MGPTEKKKLSKLETSEKQTKIRKRSNSDGAVGVAEKGSAKRTKHGSKAKETLSFDHQYIVAPMVGASELPFRLLCRKYGAQCAYTPMMSAAQFGKDPAYRKKEFQTTPFDRPLVCHFGANDPKEFALAAKAAEPYCDAIDLNLGCPQRTAYVGHFGSYLLDKKDRQLVLDIVKAGVSAVKIPILVKIRLLDTFEQTLELVRQLDEAGVGLIAVHARIRASFQRNGPGARDGAALLDQVAQLQKALPHVRLVTNGNTITYEDVVANLGMTKADGIMSAEGLLDNPALFLGRLGTREDSDKKIEILQGDDHDGATNDDNEDDETQKKKRKLSKKRRQIEAIEAKLEQGETLTDDQLEKLSTKAKVEKKLQKLERKIVQQSSSLGSNAEGKTYTTTTTLGALYEAAEDKIGLASEYLQLARKYPATMRTVIFHVRRMLKQQLATYQLMEECLACTTIQEIQAVLDKLRTYDNNPEKFVFDREKAKREKDALERKRLEEGKRKLYEARMMRKAKREGKSDLDFYLRQGAAVPTQDTVKKLKTLEKQAQLNLWKEREHSQHCMAFHLGACQRGKGCAFLHLDTKTKNTFEERDEVAG
jgi:tRNA-dihydrouridine synthase 1